MFALSHSPLPPWDEALSLPTSYLSIWERILSNWAMSEAAPQASW